ncbi:hypothetical protein ACTXP8_26520, partial [Klebsiella pneumoniae]|uniref:hypothetical protein n=1 Tax=Klebsiella pneumoniae TaxID=573 RepID=UPI003FCF6290
VGAGTGEGSLPVPVTPVATRTGQHAVALVGVALAEIVRAGIHSTTYQTINVNIKGFEKAFGPYSVDPTTGRVIISDHPAYKFGEISEANAAL